MKKLLPHIGLAFIMFVFWLIPYILIDKGINYTIAENIILIFLGVVIGASLSLFKNTLFALEAFIYIPFIFSHTLDGYTIPVCLFIAAGLAFIGMVIHIIRFKIKIKFPKLFISFCVFAFGLLIGGIATKEEYWWTQFFVMLFACVGLLAILVFFNSTVEKPAFIDICNLLIIFGFYIILQGLIAVVIKSDFTLALINGRMVDVGWGRCNNIGVVLLLVYPLPAYYMFKYPNSIVGFIASLIGPSFFAFAIFFFMSKGSVAVAFCGIILQYLFLFIYLSITKQWKRFFVVLGWVVVFVGLGTVVILVANTKIPVLEQIKAALDTIKYYGNTLNGRTIIWERALKAVMSEQPIFGFGLFAGYNEIFGADMNDALFNWCHSTLIQALFSGGIVGLLCMLYHLFIKYFYLFKNISAEKFILICSFLASGIYGMIDVSYFFINYMILFIVIVVLCDDIYQDNHRTLKKQFKKFNKGYEKSFKKEGVA